MADVKYVIDTSDISEAEYKIKQWANTNKRSIDQVNKSMVRMSNSSVNSLDRMTQAAQRSSKGFKHFASIGLQQVGYQVSDFAVQVQGGTNALVAFGQQGSQLAGLLFLIPGMFGAIAGAVTSIAIPAITAFLHVLQKSNESSSQLAKQVSDDLTDAIKSAREEADMFGTVFRDAVELVAFQTIGKLGDEISQIEQQIASMSERDVFGRLTDGAGNTAEYLQITTEELERQRAELQEQYNTLVRIRNVIEQKNRAEQQRAEYVRQVSEALIAQREGYAAAVGMSKTLTNQTEAYISEVTLALKKSDALRENLGDAAYEALRLAGVDMTSGISAAADAALSMAERLGIALMRALAIQRMAKAEGDMGLDPFGGPGDWKYDLPSKYIPESRGRRGTGGGTSGGGTKQLTEQEKMLEKLRKDLAATTEELNRREEARIETFSSIVENGLESLVTGAQSVEDAFKSMLQNILLEIWRQAVAKPIGESIGGIISGLIPGLTISAKGNAFMNGNLTPFARGGIVNSPTVFPMANGMGLMGEAGPEAVMPLRRGRNGRLGVEVNGGAANVTQVFNINGNGDRYILEKIQQAAPQIAEATKASLIKDRQRGGAMKQVFR